MAGNEKRLALHSDEVQTLVIVWFWNGDAIRAVWILGLAANLDASIAVVVIESPKITANFR
jgi:hypothetical protein